MKHVAATVLGLTLALVPGGATRAAGFREPAPASTEPGPSAQGEADLREAARLRGAALVAMEEGNYAAAIEPLLELARLLPDNILPPVNLAIAYLQLDRSEEATAQIRRAESLSPANPQMLFALARILEAKPEAEPIWSQTLERFASAHPGDPRPHFLRARRAEDRDAFGSAAEALESALDLDPENLALMTELLASAAQAQEFERTADAIDAIEDRLNGFDGGAAEFAGKLRTAIDNGDPQALRPPALVLRNLLRPTELYQLGLRTLTGRRPGGVHMFPQLDFEPPLPKSVQGGQDIDIAFSAVGAVFPIARNAGFTAVPDLDANGEALLTGAPSGAQGRILRWTDSSWAAIGETAFFPAGSAFGDLDQDESLDLVTGLPGGGLVLHSNAIASSGASGSEAGVPLGLELAPGALLRPADLDHDGDLDLLAAGPSGLRFLRNLGNAGWEDATRGTALTYGPRGRNPTHADVADFDGDGDLDVLAAGPGGLDVFMNPRRGPFSRETEQRGLAGLTGFTGAVIEDFDDDGAADIWLWGDRGHALLANRSGRFEVTDTAIAQGGSWTTASAADFDNDGDVDIVSVSGDSAQLVRNRRGSFTVEPIQLDATGVRRIVHGDFDRDGDLDLAAETPEGLSLWRNDGGNKNNWLRLRLKGKNDNNAKNNTQGLHARIELRSGDRLQTRLGNGGFNHFGLGARRQSEVVRVIWTNGLPQVWQLVSANRTLVEEQILKGSCPFLYAWNGDGFEFVTDLMWKSPLGMTLPDGSAAPHQSARDFVLIPSGALAESDGEFWLQVTGELWETIYLDRLELLAIDSPEGVELVVDERFLPPPYPAEAPLHTIDRGTGSRLRPIEASDETGRDVLDRLIERDGVYVDSLPLGRYQGTTRGHSLTLTFDGVPATGRLRLLLSGWIFPTDTSINYALEQGPGAVPVPPSLEIETADGWRTLVPSIGFPNGKRKAMVVDLPALPAGRVTLRIPTSMQIYWDDAALAVGDPTPELRVVRIDPARADLHYRGFSRLYRASASGPHLFDYEHVEVDLRFPHMSGRLTRFGEVGELLLAEDDRYVVMGPGDELTVRLPVDDLPPPAEGWRRDFVLYTDGWVKDADLHTKTSQTVEPLPYHGMRAYPDTPDHRHPHAGDLGDFAREYLTRSVSAACLNDAIRPESDGASVLDCFRSDGRP
ncbi:MAG: FG-GAP-like repeat-containing protein [Thermoanaerobaculia bacterium]